MDTNQAADSWAQAQSEARKIAATLTEGGYWYEWDDYEAGDEPGEQVTAEVRRELGKRGLTVLSDDKGMRVANANVWPG